MNIVETLTGKSVKVRITAIEKNDFKKLNKKRYFFDWYKYKHGYLVYKLTKTDTDDILGVMATIDVPSEFRIEIALICCSRENYGSAKQFDRVVGCLIAFAAQKAFEKYGYNAAVSLLPKTEIRAHYKNKYGMIDAGKQVFLFDESLKNVIKEYL